MPGLKLYILENWIFPTTRYQGSKRKLLPWIYENIKSLEFESASDLFGGSGVVSYLFKKMGKSTIYNDYLNFNCWIGKAIIENSCITLDHEDIKFILNEKIHSSNTFISETFSDIYFTENENRWLDSAYSNIGNLCIKYSGKNLEYKKALAYYALFQSCIIKRPFNLFHRKNLALRKAVVKRRFGNKTTWETPFDVFFSKFANEANSLVFSNGKTNESTNNNVFSMIGVDSDLVYLDPPYFSQDRSIVECDYSRMYHFLEGLVNYETWRSLIDYKSLNLHFKENGYKWPDKENILSKFDTLFMKLSKNIIVLSYKSHGIPCEDELVSILKKYKRSVTVNRLPYHYALRKPRSDKSLDYELLIIAK